MDNTSDHLEHIEHSQHASHGGAFDRKVAMTMAIVAALLATVTMLSHRAHNRTLQLLGEATRLQSDANIKHTQAADQWGFYQAKNIRSHEYTSMSKMVRALSDSAMDASNRKALVDEWQAKAKQYDETDLKEIKEKAEQYTREAEEMQEQAKGKLEASEHEHHHGDRFDLSELGVEFGLVLCSLAVLTKRAPFWLVGMVSALVGIGLALSAFLMS
jgi:hypothetical protein